jgi:glycosyltransferase involved in cell wall biosynthesis
MSPSASAPVPSPASGERRPDAVAAAATLDPGIREDFAVVVPAFDEAEVIADTVIALREAFDRYGLGGEVIVVDDGSRDDTARIATEAAAGWDAFRLVRHRVNLGKTEAMLTAAARTTRTWLVLFDADLQHEPDEIPRFLARLQGGVDIVTGRKIGAYDKRAVSSVYNALSRRIFRVPVSDLNSMKAFRREILDGMHLRHDWHRFFVVLAHARGWSVAEIDIALHPRKAGVSKYQGPGRVVVGVLDLLSVAFLLRFAQKPLLFFGVPGAVLFGLGALTGFVALWLRFVEGFGFRPLLYLVILLVTVGVLLIGVGFLGELVAQMRDDVDAERRRRGSPRDVVTGPILDPPPTNHA